MKYSATLPRRCDVSKIAWPGGPLWPCDAAPTKPTIVIPPNPMMTDNRCSTRTSLNPVLLAAASNMRRNLPRYLPGAVATNPPLDLVLTPINGPGRSVNAWISMFHLVFVALDPRNERSRWILDTATRVFNTYDEADCRVAWLVGGDAADTRRFLGRLADEVLTFIDPAYTAIRAFGLSSLPAIVHLG